MITSDRELKAALEWIEYWKSTRDSGQSWIGNEQAAQKIIELRRQIDDYRKHGPAGSSPESPAAEAPSAAP